MPENTNEVASPVSETISNQNNSSSPENETQDRRYFSQKERESMDDEDFAGPHQSFPIKSQEDVHNAAKLIGHADNPDAVKSRIKAIAKRKGFALPDSWQEEKERVTSSAPLTMITTPPAHDIHEGTHDHHHAHLDGYAHAHSHDHFKDAHHDHTHGHAHHRTEDGSIERATTKQTMHEVTDGSHHHQHDHMDGYSHAHHHVHSNDVDHDHAHIHAHPHHNHPVHRSIEDHSHTQEEREKYKATERAVQITTLPTMYAPFTRVDAIKREVIGQATAEVPDSYGTIFAYYPKAWETWRGNIREQHDPKKAVGKRIQHFLHEDDKSVDLHIRVSRGANDTWMKVEDDVLTGFSLSVIPDAEFGNTISTWPKKEYQGKMYPYLPRYSIAEVSLVDNPSCPGCNIQIVRADGVTTDVVEIEEEVEKKQLQRNMDLKEAAMPAQHDAIAQTLRAAIAQMKACDCSTCQSAMKAIDPDMDGDIDLGGFDDVDNDAAMRSADMQKIVTDLIDRSMQPLYARFQKIAGQFSRMQQSTNIEEVMNGQFERMNVLFKEKLDVLATKSSFDELRADLSTVKGQVEKIAEQPMPGGPVLNASSMPNPIEKKTSLEPPISYGKQSYGSVYDAIAQMAKSGQLDTPEKQTDAMTAALIAQRQGRR